MLFSNTIINLYYSLRWRNYFHTLTKLITLRTCLKYLLRVCHNCSRHSRRRKILGVWWEFWIGDSGSHYMVKIESSKFLMATQWSEPHLIMTYHQRYFKHNIRKWEEAAPLIRIPAYSLSPDLPHDLDRCVPQGRALHMGLLPFLYLHLLHFLREVCRGWNQEDIMIPMQSFT